MNNTNNMAKLSRGNSKEVPESRNFAPSAVTTSWVGNCGCTCLCPNPPK